MASRLKTAVKPKDGTAAAQSAGYVLQLTRALHHLAIASSQEDVVAIEHFDDVAVTRDGRLVLVEQDKSTSRQGARILHNRSRALWRTLQVWLQIREGPGGADCKRHLLYVSRWVASPIASLLKERVERGIRVSIIVEALREEGGKRSSARIQAVITDVLSRSDQALEALIKAIEIVVASGPDEHRSVLANGFGVDPRADADHVIDGLLGWLASKVSDDWANRRPALVSRREALVQSATLQDRQRKSRLLPRASCDVVVTADAQRGALARNFVEHLGRISAEHEDVLQAVDHFLKFNIEKHRLVTSGEVPTAEWGQRSRRLQERWQNIMRRRRREMSGATAATVGQAVLADATYDHLESIDGHPCFELYMTSGNYHRLAEGDDVWWDPNFTPGGNA